MSWPGLLFRPTRESREPVVRRPLFTLVGVAVVLGACLGARSACAATPDVRALLRELESPDFTTAFGAAEALGRLPAHRTRIVPALIRALKTRDWNRCGGDMRDAIARSLGELGAREAVVPLLELVRSGKPIEHECVE